MRYNKDTEHLQKHGRSRPEAVSDEARRSVVWGLSLDQKLDQPDSIGELVRAGRLRPPTFSLVCKARKGVKRSVLLRLETMFCAVVGMEFIPQMTGRVRIRREHGVVRTASRVVRTCNVGQL